MSEHEDDKRDDREQAPAAGSDDNETSDQTIEDSRMLEAAALRDATDASDAAAAATEPPEVKAKVKAKPTSADKKSKLLGNLIFVVGFLVTLVLGYFVGQWVRVKFGDKPEPESADRYRVELRGDEPMRGPEDALVTIIEFADYQCPYCAAASGPLDSAMASYEGDVRLIFKHYPLPGHTLAAPAAYAAWAAHQQGEFWEFHERLFEDKASIEHIPEWIKDLGLDAKQFATDLESSEARQAVDQDMLSGSKIGVTGTPAFYVNGHLYRGKRDQVGWRKIIDAELAYAKDVVDEGVAQADLYAHLMEDALERQVGAPDRTRPARKRRPGEPDDTSVYKVPLTGRPIKGPDTALVTIVEFADYHCPYCSKVKVDIERVLAEHPDQVRFAYVQRPLPSLHPQAADASKAALAALQQGKFWEMHDILFLRRLKTMDQFLEAAAEIGLDLEQFKADFDGEAVAAQLADDNKLAQKYGINGTPAFFVNGRYVSGAQGYAVFEALVAEHIEEAKLMVTNGTAPSAVYDTLMATAKTSVED